MVNTQTVAMIDSAQNPTNKMIINGSEVQVITETASRELKYSILD
eukprot:CAMPEP_0185598042 /NCGR_PEP_ID=MMETSP0434-20130131/81750_1 /TAXON_ID=626734 ORGANISM="Favella taraikaensis, Strain Fe Narragansett Bay" /NCGR_SAMPLE_ID=MMETSP0434 /ASSEMBLY_ACC=CAM_ASM_000379 /LENGTH=44 /DNA_ID= /DNA_START= /DNA_END= /DNA_ORIENTATION=